MVVVYKCKFTNTEYVTDSFFQDKTDEYDGSVWAIQSHYKSKGGESYGIGEEDDIGEAEKVLNVEDACLLQKTKYKKKEFMTWAGSYLKKVAKEFEDEDEKKAFKSGCKKFIKFVVANFKEMDFYLNQDFNEDGLVVPAHWGENATPVFYFINSGLKAEKY